VVADGRAKEFFDAAANSWVPPVKIRIKISYSKYSANSVSFLKAEPSSCFIQFIFSPFPTLCAISKNLFVGFS
jgi:hypothetical protein